MGSQPPESDADRTIQTSGGAYIGESVNTGGGDFVGRDQVTIEQVAVYITQIRRDDQPKGWDGRAPYVGLNSFRESQADLFFGREKLITNLIDKFKATRFLCVSGPSGSGKSSLVQAGIIPALRANQIVGSNSWLIETLTPSNQPLENLALALGRMAKSPDAADYMRSHIGDPATLHTQVETLLSYQPDQRAVIVVDQFEEIFTQTKDETVRQPFLNLLTHAAQLENGRVIVLLVMRSDFVSQCATYPDLRKLLSGHIELVGAMEPEELARAIALPALEVGVEVKPDLVAQVINDMAGEPGALPLMEFALEDLFAAHPKQKGQFVELTRQEYLLRGGIQQALERHAEAAFKLLSAEQKEIARTIFMHLIEIGRGTVDTRRTATFAELVPSGVDASQVASIEQILADARLITTEDQQAAQIRGDAQPRNPQFSTHTITLAHEALINAWPWLKQLVRENRSAIELQNQIGEDAAAWAEGRRDASYLYTGARLQTVQERRAAKQIRLNELAEAFIRTGVQEQQRRTRNGYMLTSAIGILILAILGAIIFGQSQRANDQRKADATLQAEVIVAQQHAHRAKASQLASTSEREVAQPVYDPSLALLLAMQAVTMTQPSDGQLFMNATIALDNAVRNAPPWRMTLQGHSDAVRSASFSPNGQRIVTASDDTTAKIWDAVSGKELLTLRGHTGGVTAATFSPDGQRIVTASADYTARIWSAATGKLLFTLTGHTGLVYSAVFSPDGARIATASDDNTIRLWNANNEKQLLLLAGHTAFVFSVAFSPDGKRLVSASNDHTARVWDAETGRFLFALIGHTNMVNSAFFSPSGAEILTAADDGTLRLWDAQTGKEKRKLISRQDAINFAAFRPDGKRIVIANVESSATVVDAIGGEEILNLQGSGAGTVLFAAFSPDGQHIVTANLDSTAKIWDIASGKALLTLHGHMNGLSSAAFSSDGQRIVTTVWSYDTAKVWDVTSGEALLTLQGGIDNVRSAAFNPDGQRIVTANWDNTAKIWDAANGKELLTLQGHLYYVNSATFSPNGQRIVTASNDHTAKIWDAASGKELLTLQGHINFVRSAAFSPNGQWIVTASNDHTAKIWDAASGKQLLTLRGHRDIVNSAAFSPNGQRIVTASNDHTAKIWDAASGKELLTLQGHKKVVSSAAFSPNGQRIVTASHDYTIKVWDTVSGEELMTLQRGTKAVNSAAFSPDGQLIVTSGNDRTARTWFSSVEEYLKSARRLVQRNPPVFTAAERQQYGLDEILPLLAMPEISSTPVTNP